MLVFADDWFIENARTSHARNHDRLCALGDIYVRTVLARLRRNLDERNGPSGKNGRFDFGRWNGIVFSRAVAFLSVKSIGSNR